MDGKVVGEYSPNKIDRLLTPEMADKATRRRVMMFLEGVQAAILEANCAVMARELPQIDQEHMLRMAVRVAELRADYIACGLRLAEHRHPSDEDIAELARHRVAYEEMMSVFSATERVVERGYVKLHG